MLKGNVLSRILAFFTILFCSAVTLAELSVETYDQVSSTRISRYAYEYIYQVTVANPDGPLQNVTATVASNAATTIVTDAELSFGAIDANGSATSTDTFTIQHDRRYPFDPSALQFTFESEAVIGPTVSIDSPVSLTTVGVSPITVTGSISPDNAILALNGVDVAHSDGQFSAQVSLEEGFNVIEARAVLGDAIVSDTISISLDATPPYVTIESHNDGDTVYEPEITVTGLINDIVRGTIEQEQAVVSVNGVEATIVNRSYSAALSLVEGPNTITVTGTDQVGNTDSSSINIIYEIPQGKTIKLTGGQNQSAKINSEVASPLQIQVFDDNDAPVIGETVVFRVIQGSGAVGVGSDKEGRAVVVETNEDGMASTAFRLGARVGTANHKVRAAVVGYDGEVVFNASATGETGDKLSVNSGNNQRGAVGQVLPEPLVVVVTDSGANVVAGARVEFNVTQGDGVFKNGQSKLQLQTDSDGRAAAEFKLGTLTGLDAQRVTATLLDGPEGRVINAGFNASAFEPKAAGQTSISGVVLDNQDSPIEGVIVYVDGTTRQSVTDAEGRFQIEQAPVGPVHLIADGSQVVGGEYPSLAYNLVTVSGVVNPLSSPIYMVKLDTENAVYAGPADAVLELPEFPGFKLEIAKDSVTFPDGAREGYISVTPVNASKVPKTPPNGMQPQFIITIQPTNALFDPPARLTLPNVDGHAPGAQVEMFSFDHDLEEFVSVGLGTVSEDGSVVRSNPGVGVVKAGWHCGAQPGGSGCAHSCPVCKDCDGNCNCVPVGSDPRLASMDSEGDCQKPECQGGSPTQVPDDGDVPDTDVEGDCKKPGCENGSVVEENDDSDISEEDAKCQKCADGSLVADESKNDSKCGDGTPEQECLVCKDGTCEVPDCDASDITHTLSLETDEIATKFFARVNRFVDKMPWGRASVTPSVSGSITTGEECCQDCTKPVTKGDYYEGSGSLGVDLRVEIGPKRAVNIDWDSPRVAGYSVDFEVKGEVKAIVGLDTGLSGTVSGKYNPTCEEGCIGIQASASLAPLAEASAELSEFDFEVDGPSGSEFDIVDVKQVEISAGIQVGASSVTVGASRGSAAECDSGCSYEFGSGALEATVSGGSVTLLGIDLFSLPAYTFEWGLWDGVQGSCS